MALDASTGLSSSESSEVIAQSSNEVYDDFNGDGFDDLAVGISGENVGSISDAGAVEVIYADPSSGGGLQAQLGGDQFWTQHSPNVNDPAEANGGFGASLR
jgi:hypothetical protein